MSVDAETRKLARDAAGAIRAAKDQLDAAYAELVRLGAITPMEQRQECEACGGLGHVGRWSPDPQLNECDPCEECEGQGYVPPLDEPPSPRKERS